METFWHALTIIAMVGLFLGGLVILGFVVIWILGLVDWTNRGSH